MNKEMSIQNRHMMVVTTKKSIVSFGRGLIYHPMVEFLVFPTA